jgi:hypothetical protein
VSTPYGGFKGVVDMTEEEMIAAVDNFKAAMDDPEIAGPMREAFAHLGSTMIDPTGTLDLD